MHDIYYQALDQTSLIMKETYYGITHVRKKYHYYMFLKIEDVKKESLDSIKMK